MTPQQEELISQGLAWIPATRIRRLPSVRDQRREDLEAEARLRLCEAVLRWDPERTAWRSYAILAIRGAMLEYLRNEAWEERNCRERRARIEEAEERLEARGIRSPSNVELATETGITEAQVCESRLKTFVSADAPIVEDGELLRLGDAIPDEGESVEAMILGQADVERLWRAVDGLGEPWTSVIRLRFVEDLTMREIAVRIGGSASWAALLRDEALEALRGRLAEQ
jgi:RNA polymerase sigma factor (sigma-70 family)